MGLILVLGRSLGVNLCSPLDIAGESHGPSESGGLGVWLQGESDLVEATEHARTRGS